MSLRRAARNTAAVAAATTRVSPRRAASIRPNPNAVAVLAITTGLRTGAPSRKAIATGGGSPLRNRRRTTITTPHSQTGKINPNAAPASTPTPGRSGTQRASVRALTPVSITPDSKAPAATNGAASMKMPRKIVVNACSRSAAVTGSNAWSAVGVRNARPASAAPATTAATPAPNSTQPRADRTGAARTRSLIAVLFTMGGDGLEPPASWV